MELEPGDYRSTSLTSTTFDDFTAPMDSIDLEITMEDGYGFVIDNGCAVQTGSFLLENGVLTVTRLLTTLIGCTAPDGDAGSFVDELLSEPVTVTHSDNDLMWTNSFGEIVFSEVP
ncbi:META domain-containing protein [Rathayibacter sp. VKM Ac-2857]|uniref:META domain-containing protein n=1 Tax=Rathayibacter sp. VKM Ac-2857 TaxID=2739020 RepID=UPI0015674CAE|nr:META domain-containing protein [Rathayibacter sp. VKM Ac-2857]NQX18011.1 META domain-containing protein [Rathayibacter sp. VKM Ac-2857]